MSLSNKSCVPDGSFVYNFHITPVLLAWWASLNNE